jgi:hypothetical protein
MKRTNSTSSNLLASVSKVWSFGAIVLAFTFFSVSTVSAQTYVSGDQAVEILKQEVEDLQDRGFTAYNAGNHSLVYDLGYQYRYALGMIEKIQTGSSVANAIEAALPNVPFILGNLETGLTHTDSQMDLRRNQLRNYGKNLLTI